MFSKLIYYISYGQILLKAQVLRSLILIVTSIGQWTGTVPSVKLRPFERFVVRSTKSNRRIRVNAYRNKAALRPDVGPVAVHLNWHGSGFVVYSFGESVPYIAHLLSSPKLKDYPLVILDCDYAKAPENPYPAAPRDARDIFEHVLAHPETYDPTRITVGGFSAGGNLALGLSATVGKKFNQIGERHPIQAVVGFYPLTEYDSRPDVERRIPHGLDAPGIKPIPGLNLLKLFDDSYFFPLKPMGSRENEVRNKALQRMPLVAPFYAATRDFPKDVCLVTCEYDSFTEANERLRERLKKDGTNVTGWEVKGVRHAWDVMVMEKQPGFDERNRTWDLVADMLVRVGAQ